MKSIEKINNIVFFVTELDLSKCTTVSRFLEQMASCFSFPEYFGHNLDALDECMTDLSWIEEQNFKVTIKSLDVLRKRDERLAKNVMEYLNEYKNRWDEIKERQEDKTKSNFIIIYA